MGDEIRQGVGGGHIHLIVDFGGPDIKGPPEDAGEGQDVIDLVGIVGPAGGDHFGPACFGFIREDLRRGIGTGEDNGVPVHGPDHLGGEGAGSRDADEHIDPPDDVPELAGFFLQIGDLGHFLLDPVEVFPAGVNGAGTVGHDDVVISGRQKQLDNGDGGGACARGDYLDLLLPLAHHLEGIGEAGQGDDGSAVLVIVEHGDVARFLQLPFNFKTPGSGNVLQIDATKGAGDEGNGIDKFIHIFGFDTKGEGIYPPKGLEEDTLALHHRHTGLGANVSQTQDGGAIGDDGAEIVPPSEVIGPGGVLLNFQTRLGHAGGIGQGQVVLGGYGNPGHHFNFSLPFLMEPEGFFCIIHTTYPPRGLRTRILFYFTMEAALGQEWRFFLHGNQFSNYENYAILKGMDRTTLTDFFEEVETTEEYNGYFCSIAEAISIVVLGSLCGFQNVSQIHQWAESGRCRARGV